MNAASVQKMGVVVRCSPLRICFESAYRRLHPSHKEPRTASLSSFLLFHAGDDLWTAKVLMEAMP
jgi:hypothetical protein